MNQPSRILVLAPDLPFPARGGGQMRMACLIPFLAESAAVHVACTHPQLPESTAGWARRLGISIEALPPRNRSGPAERLARLRELSNLTNLEFRRDEKRRFDRVFREFKPELVWLETPYLLRYALDWTQAVPLVVDYWGTSEGAERICRMSSGGRRALAWLRWRLARRGEKRYAPRLSAIACVSELDAAYFRRIAPACPVFAIANVAAKPPAGHATPGRPEADGMMVFSGDMSYWPNVDAAVHFAHEIFPAVRAAVPGARIVFAGRNPHPRVRDLARLAGVAVTGEVPDLAAEIARSALYVLPMRLGSGIRTKLFEVFHLEVPIVTTATGAEGLALVHGENCLVAESAAEFAQACIRLLDSPSERRRLGRNASRLAAENYSPNAVRRQVRAMLEGLCPPPGRPAAGSLARPGRPDAALTEHGKPRLS
jgi:glycosyltransferase involved in cell wall biosynthesis